APEHILTGRITPQILDLLGMPYRVLSAESAADDVAWAAKEMDTRMQPVAILVPPRVVQTGGAHHDAGIRRDADPRRRSGAGDPAMAPGGDAPLVPRISRLAAITAARKPIGTEPIVHANGYICRESFSVGDRPQNFYMIGSMGLASAIRSEERRGGKEGAEQGWTLHLRRQHKRP